jgi:ABC-2 type transport system permease protein
MIRKYLKVWWFFTKATAQISFQSRFGSFVFLIGKILRFLLFFLFLFLLLDKTKSIGGYTIWQIIFFYATFNFIDSSAQFFMREVYRFRSLVVRGSFDYIATQPISPLFRGLFGGSDLLDIPILIIGVIFIFISAGHVGVVTWFGILGYIFLVVNALLIALAFHIIVLSLAILTTEVDNAIMLYRDLTQMGRVPIDVYTQPIRSVLTFAIPVGIMMTFPAKALMGLLSFQSIVIAGGVGIAFIYLSLKLWQYSLRYYSSASS